MRIFHSTSLFTLLIVFSVASTFANDGDDLLLNIPSIVASSQSSNSTNPTPTNPNNNSAKPGPNNTGARGALTPLNSSLTVTQNGQVVQNLAINGCINVKANNVTIRNVRINCSGFYAIRIFSGFTGTIMEDIEMFNMQSSGVLGSDFILRRANIHDSGGDAVKPGSNVLIERSWFHRLGYKADSHSDGVQMVAGNNVTIRQNNIDMPHNLSGFTNSQCMIIQTNNGPINNIVIDRNWLNGGGFCVQINDKGRGYGSPTNVTISNNMFGPDCQFGTILVRGSNQDTELINNIFEATGDIIGESIANNICGNDL